MVDEMQPSSEVQSLVSKNLFGNLTHAMGALKRAHHPTTRGKKKKNNAHSSEINKLFKMEVCQV